MYMQSKMVEPSFGGAVEKQRSSKSLKKPKPRESNNQLRLTGRNIIENPVKESQQNFIQGKSATPIRGPIYQHVDPTPKADHQPIFGASIVIGESLIQPSYQAQRSEVQQSAVE